MSYKRTLVITGGAGFIGSHVVRLFVNKYLDYKIINLDKLTYAGNLANLKDVEDKPNYKFVKMDICDFDGVLKLMQEEGIVFQTGVNIGKDKTAESVLNEFDAVVLACGASQPRDLAVSGREAKGIHFAVEYLTEATKTLLNGKNPAESPFLKM